MQKKLTQLFIFLLLLALVWQGQLWWQARQPVAEPTGESEAAVLLAEPLRQHSFTAEREQQSALELVSGQVDLELKEYDFGVMVQAVDGLAADSEHYWAVYHNGDYAMVGLADLELAAGDQVELVYEAIIL